MEFNYMYESSQNDTTNETGDSTPLPFVSRFTLALMVFLIITSNLIVLIILRRMKGCATKMQILLQSLALADLLVGLVWFVLQFNGIFGFNFFKRSNWECTMIVNLLSVVLAASVLTLSLISVERYIAVVKPFKYHKLITRPRAKWAVLCVWSMSFALFLPVFIAFMVSMDNHLEENCEQYFLLVISSCFYILSAIIIPNMFISLYCYTYIIMNILKRDKFIRDQQSSFRQYRRRSDRTLVKISISVFSGFYITWLPFVVVNFVTYVNVVDVSPVVYHSTLNIGIWNSVLNCLIYSLSHRPFQMELKRMLQSLCCCCCGKKTASVPPKIEVDSWHGRAFRSPKTSRTNSTRIAHHVTRGSESDFNVINVNIAMEISGNI